MKLKDEPHDDDFTCHHCHNPVFLCGHDQPMDWEGWECNQHRRPEETNLNKLTGDMRDLQSNKDTEVAHESADDILVDALRQLGFDELVDEYMKIKKWYA